MTFDADAVGKALRCVGMDLSDAVPPVDLGDGRWRVEAVSRMRRDPLGVRVVAFSRGKWTVDRSREPEGRGGDVDPVGGGAE